MKILNNESFFLFNAIYSTLHYKAEYITGISVYLIIRYLLLHK